MGGRPNFLIRRSPRGVRGHPQPSIQPENRGSRFRQRPQPSTAVHTEWPPTWLPAWPRSQKFARRRQRKPRSLEGDRRFALGHVGSPVGGRRSRDENGEVVFTGARTIALMEAMIDAGFELAVEKPASPRLGSIRPASPPKSWGSTQCSADTIRPPTSDQVAGILRSTEVCSWNSMSSFTSTGTGPQPCMRVGRRHCRGETTTSATAKIARQSASPTDAGARGGRTAPANLCSDGVTNLASWVVPVRRVGSSAHSMTR